MSRLADFFVISTDGTSSTAFGEPPLGVPSEDGMVLASSAEGVREWVRLVSTILDDTFTISTSTTAANKSLYILSANLTLTLPLAPEANSLIGVFNASGVKTCVIGRNGEKINGAAENMTVDILNTSFLLLYSGASFGWVTL